MFKTLLVAGLVVLSFGQLELSANDAANAQALALENQDALAALAAANGVDASQASQASEILANLTPEQVSAASSLAQGALNENPDLLDDLREIQNITVGWQGDGLSIVIDDQNVGDLEFKLHYELVEADDSEPWVFDWTTKDGDDFSIVNQTGNYVVEGPNGVQDVQSALGVDAATLQALTQATVEAAYGESVSAAELNNLANSIVASASGANLPSLPAELPALPQELPAELPSELSQADLAAAQALAQANGVQLP